jgi:DnaJ-class molecular chaperone
VYHDASEEKIQKAFSNKIEGILSKYKSKNEIKSIKKDNELNTLISILYKDKSKEGKENKAEFEEVKRAYETLSNKQKKAAYDEENKDLFSERNRAVRLLIHYNQSFAKY